MIFYTAVDEQGRTHWEKTQADARAINKNFEQVDVPTDKSGLHVWLNAMQQKLDDLTEEVEVTTPTPALKELMQPEPKTEGYAEKSVRFEDDFDNMPLATQFHYAARAMENARDALP